MTSLLYSSLQAFNSANKNSIPHISAHQMAHITNLDQLRQKGRSVSRTTASIGGDDFQPWHRRVQLVPGHIDVRPLSCVELLPRVEQKCIRFGQGESRIRGEVQCVVEKCCESLHNVASYDAGIDNVQG